MTEIGSKTLFGICMILGLLLLSGAAQAFQLFSPSGLMAAGDAARMNQQQQAQQQQYQLEQ